MPISKQLLLSKLLHRMQNGLRLTIGPLGMLNYEMASYVSLIYRMVQYIIRKLQLISNISDDKMHLSVFNAVGSICRIKFTIQFDILSKQKWFTCRIYTMLTLSATHYNRKMCNDLFGCISFGNYNKINYTRWSY